ncbi:MAG TPA: isoprenylcysteine carboxylmethyltransferase family protein [Vicinamibacterales bacterium]|nr:isoprenylcysteine carboxylmethyltransferase family protein [Vicinamibacterales bacterium]
MVLWLCQPSWRSLGAGGAVAVAGEALRVWAAGHLEKSREVTRSGPYRWTRHPLYLGSAVIALGIAIASASAAAASLIIVYVATAFPAAILAEEAHLREKFGDEYDTYASNIAVPAGRRFSLARARRNREDQAIVGVFTGFLLLALKLLLHPLSGFRYD